MTATRREVLAFIALQDDLPMPAAIAFVEQAGQDPALELKFDRTADARPWRQSMGLHLESSALYYLAGTWRGWAVWLDVPDDDSLDPNTTAALREIAEPDEGGAS